MLLTLVIAWQVVQVMPGLAGRVVHVVVIRVVEFAREERHRDRGSRRTSGRPASSRRAPARPCASRGRWSDTALLLNELIVVRRVKPAVVGVLVAFQAVVVHHQGLAPG